MLNSIQIEAFKSFPSETIKLRDLTLLCGFNNSGKSSVIQAIRMHSNAYEAGIPLLAGHGSVDEIRSRLAPPAAPVIFRASYDDGSTSEYWLSDTAFRKPERSPICYYLSADRLGPQVVLPVEHRLNTFPIIGARGEYVAGFLEALRNLIVPSALRHERAQGRTLEYQLIGWLGEIAPGIELQYRTDKKRDTGYFEFDTFRPANVGFGLSYCLPILAAALGLTAGPPTKGWKDSDLGEELGSAWERERASRGIVVLIENPEAHLHPKGQTVLGKLIARAAMCGVQFIIETQSDHLMDGIRIAVKQANDPDSNAIVNLASEAESAEPNLEKNLKVLGPDNVIFHYLVREKSGKTTLQTPVLDRAGKLSFWPEGFFDQTLKNRSVLAK